MPETATRFDQNNNARINCEWMVFDAVGTLIEPDPPVAMTYHSVGERYGSQITLQDVKQRFRSAFRRSEQDGFPGGPSPLARWTTSEAIERARWKWIVREVLSDVKDQEACFDELWNHFAQPKSWRCFADVETSLNSLANAGYRLAIASNFDHRLHAVCDELNSLKLIELRLVSTAIGYRKPAMHFYDAIIHACGCEVQRILMVGDDREHDVAAPRTAGLHALHLDRSVNIGTSDRLASLSDLVNRLAK